MIVLIQIKADNLSWDQCFTLLQDYRYGKKYITENFMLQKLQPVVRTFVKHLPSCRLETMFQLFTEFLNKQHFNKLM